MSTSRPKRKYRYFVFFSERTNGVEVVANIDHIPVGTDYHDFRATSLRDARELAQKNAGKIILAYENQFGE